MLKIIKTASIAGVVVLVTVCCSCGGGKNTASTQGASSVSATIGSPASQSTIANNRLVEGDLDIRGYLDSADGSLRISGKGQLKLAIQPVNNSPAAPPGWQLAAPVLDITARDRQDRPVKQLLSSLDLQFKVNTAEPVTVLVYNNSAWEIVPSEINADGRLTATIDHLTPYSAGSPSKRTSTPSITPALPSTLPSQVSLTTSSVAASQAQNALSKAAKPLKNKDVRISSAGGYNGTLSIALPPVVQKSLGSAFAAGGEAYYGLYSAVNEIVTVWAAGGQLSGALTVMAEPKTSLPAGSQEALNSLRQMFPGLPSNLTQVGDDSSAFTFYAVEGNTAYLAGCISYNGLVLDYVMAGSAEFQKLVNSQ
jgi:hypothetical protein